MSGCISFAGSISGNGEFLYLYPANSITIRINIAAMTIPINPPTETLFGSLPVELITIGLMVGLEVSSIGGNVSGDIDDW